MPRYCTPKVREEDALSTIARNYHLKNISSLRDFTLHQITSTAIKHASLLMRKVADG